MPWLPDKDACLKICLISPTVRWRNLEGNSFFLQTFPQIHSPSTAAVLLWQILLILSEIRLNECFKICLAL